MKEEMEINMDLEEHDRRLENARIWIKIHKENNRKKSIEIDFPEKIEDRYEIEKYLSNVYLYLLLNSRGEKWMDFEEERNFWMNEIKKAVERIKNMDGEKEADKRALLFYYMAAVFTKNGIWNKAKMAADDMIDEARKSGNIYLQLAAHQTFGKISILDEIYFHDIFSCWKNPKGPEDEIEYLVETSKIHFKYLNRYEALKNLCSAAEIAEKNGMYEKAVELYFTIGLIGQNNYISSIDYLGKVMDMAEEHDDPIMFFRALSWIIHPTEILFSTCKIDRIEETIDLLKRGLKYANKLGDMASCGEIYFQIAMLLRLKNKWKETEEIINYTFKAKEYAEKTGNKNLLGRVYSVLAYRSKGRKKEECFFKALELLKETGDEFELDLLIRSATSIFGPDEGGYYAKMVEKLINEKIVDAQDIGMRVPDLLSYGTDALKKGNDALARRIARLLAKYDEYEDLTVQKKYYISNFKKENKESIKYLEKLLEIERKIKEEESIGVKIKGKIDDMYKEISEQFKAEERKDLVDRIFEDYNTIPIVDLFPHKVFFP